MTPYTEPQIDRSVATPWPEQVNAALLKLSGEVAGLRGYCAGLAAISHGQQAEIADLKAIIVAILPVVARHTEQIADADALVSDLARRLQKCDISYRSLANSLRQESNL